MTKILIGLVISLFLTTANANYYNCNVAKVIDGDTIVVNCDKKSKLHVRLLRIDSYESKRNNRGYKQAYNEHISIDEVVSKGKKAALITFTLLSGNQVDIKTNPYNELDLYGRTLGEVLLNGVNVNDKLLTEHPDVFLKY